MDSAQQQFVSASCALVCAALGSFHDVRERRIPNRLTGPAMLTGLVLHTAFSGWRGVADAALAGIVAGAVALVFYAAGGLGAGDVKLMAAVGCLTGFSPLRTFLAATGVAGALLALAFSIYLGRLHETVSNVRELLVHHRRNGIRPHPELNVANQETLRLPFALPIAAGCLFTLCIMVWQACP